VRILSIPAVAALALYAGLAVVAATRLPRVGAWTLVASAAILAVAAIGLVTRQLAAYLFAVLFFVLTTLAFAGVGAVLVWQALTGTAGGEWAGVRNLVVGSIGAVVLVTAVLSASVVVTLAVAGRSMAASRSALDWTVSTAGALAATSLLAWLVGHGYAYRRLPAQNECLAGSGLGCYQLANDVDRFTVAERRAFARRGCEVGYDGTCRQLAALLDESHHAGSPEAVALAGRCQAGNPDTCRRLGGHLLGIGDRPNGTRYLARTCELRSSWCATAAETARERGDAALSRQLLERGCELEEARSCTALLREVRASLTPEDLARLELRACLVGDVNDCRALMRRDLRGVCPVICEGTTENRWHTCGYCARDAEAAGERALAEAWFAANCQHGYKWSCQDLARLRSGLPSSPDPGVMPQIAVPKPGPAL
jgi:hypothetical protein